jgi:hypothetical protein
MAEDEKIKPKTTQDLQCRQRAENETDQTPQKILW